MIRITTQSGSTQTVVTIDGYAEDADLREIERVRRGLKGDVRLNLRGLNACVPDGIQVLRAWIHAGARLDVATPYLELALTAPPREPSGSGRRD